MKRRISHKRLLEVLDYNPETGDFKWKHSKIGRVAGAVAGTVSAGGYWQIIINRKFYFAHRLAWFYVRGKWPRKDIDHINRERCDNRIRNLREVTQSQNSTNVELRSSRNVSGYRGVTHDRKSNKWMTRVYKDGKLRLCKMFPSLDEAVQARISKLNELFPMENVNG